MFGKTEGKNFSALSRPDSDRRARATIFPNIVLLSSERALLSQNLSRRVCRSSVDNVPRFIPLIALPFLYSPVVGNSGNEYLWTTCGLAPVYGYRRYKAREREGERGVFYSGWKERILSSVGYRLGFRLGGGESEAKGGWSLTMTIVRPPTRRERGRRMNFWTENSIVPSPGVGESVKSDLISR